MAARLSPDLSHKASVKMAQANEVSVITLNRPSRSAIRPGKKRPGMAPKFKNAMSRYEILSPTPTWMAYDEMYVMGMKTANSTRNTAMVVTA